MNGYYIDIQHACDEPACVTDNQITQWVIHALTAHHASAELTLRLVTSDEITQLNHLYRKKNSATNVLAFPAVHPKEIILEVPLLGDVIICPAVLKQESETLGVPLTAHWAHIIIHGTLHLLGYDHIKDDDTVIMQSLEIQLLTDLGFNNPYEPSTTGSCN